MLVVDDPRRQVDLNYVVIQSYPNEAMANEARELLKRSNVGTTVERGLRGWGPTWYSVVSTKGFAQRSSPECRAYMDQIKAISNQHMKQRSFKAFEPTLYKWGAERTADAGKSQ